LFHDNFYSKSDTWEKADCSKFKRGDLKLSWYKSSDIFTSLFEVIIKDLKSHESLVFGQLLDGEQSLNLILDQISKFNGIKERGIFTETLYMLNEEVLKDQCQS